MSLFTHIRNIIIFLWYNLRYLPTLIKAIIVTIIIYVSGRSHSLPQRGFMIHVAVQFFRRVFTKFLTMNIRDFVKLRKSWSFLESQPWDPASVSISRIPVHFSPSVWDAIGHFTVIEKNLLTSELLPSPHQKKAFQMFKIDMDAIEKNLLKPDPVQTFKHSPDMFNTNTDSPSHSSPIKSPHRYEIDSMTNSPIHGNCLDPELPRHRNGIPRMIQTVSQSLKNEIDEIRSANEAEALILDVIRPICDENVQNRNVIYFIHGGAFVMCTTRLYRVYTSFLVSHTGYTCYSVEYRLCPEYEFPHCLEDVISGYLYLVHQLGIDPKRIHLVGDSAGGNMALALLFYLQDNGLETPATAALFSPIASLNLIDFFAALTNTYNFSLT